MSGRKYVYGGVGIMVVCCMLWCGGKREIKVVEGEEFKQVPCNVEVIGNTMYVESVECMYAVSNWCGEGVGVTVEVRSGDEE